MYDELIVPCFSQTCGKSFPTQCDVISGKTVMFVVVRPLSKEREKEGEREREGETKVSAYNEGVNNGSTE